MWVRERLMIKYEKVCCTLAKQICNRMGKIHCLAIRIIECNNSLIEKSPYDPINLRQFSYRPLCASLHLDSKINACFIYFSLFLNGFGKRIPTFPAFLIIKSVQGWILYVGRIRLTLMLCTFLGRKYLTWYQSIEIGRDSYCQLQVQPTWPMTGRHQIIHLFICFSEQYLMYMHIYCFRLWIAISTLFQILLTLQ